MKTKGQMIDGNTWQISRVSRPAISGRADDLSFWARQARENISIVPFLPQAILLDYTSYKAICLSALQADDVRDLFPAFLNIIPSPSLLFTDDQIIERIRIRFLEYASLDAPSVPICFARLPDHIKTKEICLKIIKHFSSEASIWQIPSALMDQDFERQVYIQGLLYTADTHCTQSRWQFIKHLPPYLRSDDDLLRSARESVLHSLRSVDFEILSHIADFSVSLASPEFTQSLQGALISLVQNMKGVNFRRIFVKSRGASGGESIFDCVPDELKTQDFYLEVLQRNHLFYEKIPARLLQDANFKRSAMIAMLRCTFCITVPEEFKQDELFLIGARESILARLARRDIEVKIKPLVTIFVTIQQTPPHPSAFHP